MVSYYDPPVGLENNGLPSSLADYFLLNDRSFDEKENYFAQKLIPSHQPLATAGFPGISQIEHQSKPQQLRQCSISHGGSQSLSINLGPTTATGLVQRTDPLKEGCKSTVQCPYCEQLLGRRDVLTRHLREQHGQGREEFLCPQPRCKESRIGSGFKRQEKLDRHLKSAKHRNRRRQLVVAQPISTSTPQPENDNRNEGDATTTRGEKSPHRNTDENDTVTSPNASAMLSELKRLCLIEEESLNNLESACTEKRTKLQAWREVIHLFEGQDEN